jgi:hypothetical protein
LHTTGDGVPDVPVVSVPTAFAAVADHVLALPAFAGVHTFTVVSAFQGHTVAGAICVAVLVFACATVFYSVASGTLALGSMPAIV